MKQYFVTAALLCFFVVLEAQENAVTAPADYFGFEPGTDRKLFNYEELVGYLQKLDEESPRILMEEIGKSPMGKPMYIVFISAAENIRALEAMKQINRELALNPDIPADTLEQMVRNGKVFVLATLSMHSGEVGPSQSAPLIAWELAATGDKRKLEWLDNVVYMMVPCHNPDGMDMVVENYNKHVGTQYEGASLPRVYHKYVGHDNNRDFVILSQEDNRAISRICSHTWFPQVAVEKHQMGSVGVRYFVPPSHDPIAENVPAGIYSWAGVFGQHMATDMTAEKQAGVSQHYMFDDYWPGSTGTCVWKNVIGFLTEAASCRTATPLYVEPTELEAGGKGLSEYKKSVNMLLPWKGGWWRLGDIVQYERVSTMSILSTASRYREEILRFRNDMCRQQVEKGTTEPPFYYILPAEQHDPGEMADLVNLMQEHGVEVHEMTTDLILEGKHYHRGDVVIPLAQSFRPFIKEVMETQEFPERHYTPGGELIRPYDISSWSLPLHRHVKSEEINSRSEGLEAALQLIEGKYDLSVTIDMEVHAMVLPVSMNRSYRAAFLALGKGLRVERLNVDVELKAQRFEKGSFLVYYEAGKKEAWQQVLAEFNYPPGLVSNKRALDADPVMIPRIALVETCFHDMDAGWTRYIFDTYHIPFTVLSPGEMTGRELSKEFDVILFPDNDKDVLMTGKRKSGDTYRMADYHPDYVKGMGKDGFEKLMTFSDKGGIILAWGRSVSLFEGMLKIRREVKKEQSEEEFRLPFSDISPELSKAGLYVPGSLLKLDLIRDHPLTLGMPPRIGVFSRGRPVFQTSVPIFDMDRRVIGSYPEKDVLMSGYASEPKKLEHKAALIWLRKGKGQYVFFGFQPQFRASTQASFKLLFNALLLEKQQ
ncbi:MAG TPA: hypothetical protein ENO20_04390 [Bacteroides sp.]|nr:hypothetical protein [Bacteroides sp.]